MIDTGQFVLIYTDGACSGNPGPGGWGAIIMTPDANVRELGGAEAPTTNNRMEMKAVLEALRAVPEGDCPVQVFTDSTYVIRGITEWVWAWKRRGWKTAGGAEVQNRDIWEDMMRVVTRVKQLPGDDEEKGKRKIEWNYVRGHRGNPGNERCDRIAVGFAQKQYVSLYRGPLAQYSVDILDWPESEGLPEMRPKEEKKVAHSYLSVVDGKAMRHADWPSCERRVKGRAGAKFKKAMKPGDENEILAGWGVDPGNVKED